MKNKSARFSHLVPCTSCLVSCISCLVSCALCLTSCHHKELCDDHDDHAPKYHALVTVSYEHEWQYPYSELTDWERHWPEEFHLDYDSLRPHDPAGLRIIDYSPTGMVNTLNLPAFGGEIFLVEGEHALLFYNNDTENIIFNSIGSYDEASVTTRARSRSTYRGSPYSDTEGEEFTMNAPDMLYGHAIASYSPVKTVEAEPLEATMIPLVFTYEVRCPVTRGKERVKQARGALAGMARSVCLSTGRTSADKATILFDCAIHEQYGPHAEVRSFGIPDFSGAHYTRAPTGTYGLNIELLLTNGQILKFDFDVTDQVTLQPNGGVIQVSGIEIPDDAGDTEGSSMDVDVDGWGEFQDIDVPF